VLQVIQTKGRFVGLDGVSALAAYVCCYPIGEASIRLVSAAKGVGAEGAK